MVKTKFGDQLQFDLEGKGQIWMPQRMAKLFTVEKLLSGPPENLKIKFTGRDPKKMNTPLYEIWIEEAVEENELWVEDSAQNDEYQEY